MKTKDDIIKHLIKKIETKNTSLKEALTEYPELAKIKDSYFIVMLALDPLNIDRELKYYNRILEEENEK